MDVFNLDDSTEWGPDIKKLHEKHNLSESGYDAGDVFYKRRQGRSYAFLHYFTTEEITDLLEQAGFKVESIKYVGYRKHSGELLNQSTDGSIFIQAVATRRPVES